MVRSSSGTPNSRPLRAGCHTRGCCSSAENVAERGSALDDRLLVDDGVDSVDFARPEHAHHQGREGQEAGVVDRSEGEVQAAIVMNPIIRKPITAAKRVPTPR